MKCIVLAFSIIVASSIPLRAELDYGSSTRWYGVYNEADDYSAAAILNQKQDVIFEFRCAKLIYYRSLQLTITKITQDEECPSQGPARIVPVTFTLDGKSRTVTLGCYRDDLGASVLYMMGAEIVANEAIIKDLATAMDNAKNRSMRIESADGVIDATVTLNGSKDTREIIKACAYPKGM